ncbi:endopeptidase La [Candidatus Dependentiae bacterium]|nr:MAG: endopeptidase La [Candidatus Dependentiae bacterium]
MEDRKEIYSMDEMSQTLPVIPTIDVVVFPNMVVPLLVLDEKIIKGINAALEGNKKILLLATKPQSSGYQGPIGIQDLYTTGTISHIMRSMALPDNGIKVLAQGIARATVSEIVSSKDMLLVNTDPLPFDMMEDAHVEIDVKIRDIISLTEKVSTLGKNFGPDFQMIMSQINDSERIIDFLLSHLNITIEQSQQLLERTTMVDLLGGIYDILQAEIEVSKVQEKVRVNARESINKSQREYYLREQLKAIQKELGEESESDIEDIKEKAAKMNLSDEASLEVKRQIRRLEKTAADSLEAVVIRNHLEWVLALPWDALTEENKDLLHAKAVLDEDHFGLHDVKERILDYLSVRSLRDQCRTPILCLAGPPGVGKTSLGRSIARSLNRNFFRIALGGMHDESEIRGHRRTYVGALPGRLIQAMRKVQSLNPLIVIDEIDKLGNSGRGDPASALLEVLDPEQNNQFYDNYLGMNFDLSKVMFVTTANDISNIPGPLRDRLDIIQLSGYTREEKSEIASRYLIPKAIYSSGLESHKIEISVPVINQVIYSYTREAGVRELERTVQKLCSKYARSLIETNKGVDFSVDNLTKYLGPQRFSAEDFIFTDRVGVTNGLAWTSCGGELLQVEAVLMKGTGKFILTGQLGDVMKESAQAAMTYARAHMDSFGIDSKKFTEYDLHIHLPAGAIPKDGPSAGVTLLTSILSALTGRRINGRFAMTGELNLQGNVLPIGGLKEKILAAKQYGLDHVILPKQNQKDMINMGEIIKGIEILWAENAREVLDWVLLPKI